MPADSRTDGFKRTTPTSGPILGNSPQPSSEIFQQFSQQLDLIHPAKISAKINQETAEPPPGTDPLKSDSAQDWEHDDTVRTMINSLLAGAFDESLTVHAENLAEKLIERQRQLDRRETQLNLRSAELENKVRQARLDNVPMQSFRSADERPADQSGGDKIVTHRLDKFSESQRAPYSQLNKRWKRYIEDSKVGPASKIPNQKVEQPPTDSRAQAQIKSAQRTAIRDLTNRAAAVRQRGEDVENMFEQLREIFSEMLHQQTTLRQVVKTLQTDRKQANLSELAAATSTLDRLTVGLTRVGNQHFLLPEESADAA